jgi:hypothetical protein
LTTVRATSPVHGETGVSVTRETVVHFSGPLGSDAVLSTEEFFAEFGGRTILARVELASDRRKATLFYLEPLPGALGFGFSSTVRGCWMRAAVNWMRMVTGLRAG